MVISMEYYVQKLIKRLLACVFLSTAVVGCSQKIIVKDDVSYIERYKYKIILSADQKKLIYVGDIEPSSYINLEKLLNKSKKVEVVYLYSFGGLIDSAENMYNLVKKYQTNTLAIACYSACTRVFIGGEKRYITSSSELGFQTATTSVSSHRGDFRHEMYSVNKAAESRYIEEGVSKDFVKKMHTHDHDELWVPSNAVLVNSHVVDEVLSKKALLMLDKATLREFNDFIKRSSEY